MPHSYKTQKPWLCHLGTMRGTSLLITGDHCRLCLRVEASWLQNPSPPSVIFSAQVRRPLSWVKHHPLYLEYGKLPPYFHIEQLQWTPCWSVTSKSCLHWTEIAWIWSKKFPYLRAYRYTEYFEEMHCRVLSMIAKCCRIHVKHA